MNAVFREKEADGVGGGVLRLVGIEAASRGGITVCKDRLQTVQDRRVIVL